jgi:hypothetical protein
MSALTKCCYCTLQWMKRGAQRRGATVIVEQDEHGWQAARYSDREEPSVRFLVLTDSCAC